MYLITVLTSKRIPHLLNLVRLINTQAILSLFQYALPIVSHHKVILSNRISRPGIGAAALW